MVIGIVRISAPAVMALLDLRDHGHDNLQELLCQVLDAGGAVTETKALPLEK